jgi:SpoIID/LytB domain protein
MRVLSSAIALVLIASVSAAEPSMSRKDQAALLYSTQLQFDSRNVPIIPIAVMDRQDEVEIRSPSGFRLMLEGQEDIAVELPDARTLTARVEGGVAARLGWRVVVGSFPGGDLAGARAHRELWEERRFKTAIIELGSVFGFFGRVMDSRIALVVIDKLHDSRGSADEVAQTLRGAYVDDAIEVRSELVERPHGTVVVTAGKVTASSRDLVRVRSRDGSPLVVAQVEHGIGFSWHGRADRSYHGDLVIAADREGSTAVVNPIDAESLLKGLVPAEIYTSSPMQALLAQAVVARGELLAKIGHRHLTDPYLICSDVHCQVYKGAGQEHPRTNEAVEQTKGLMLFGEEGLVDAVYSANCGGHTENNEEAWGNAPKPSLRGVQDMSPADPTFARVTDDNVRAFLEAPPASYCQMASKGSSNFRWSVTLPAAEVTRLVGDKHAIGDVEGIRVTARGVSGRATAIAITGAAGEVEVTGELVIRKLLGGLKSSLFVVEAVPGRDGRAREFRFQGGGFGHGVGMCQTGAIGAAEAGLSFRQILEHYYQRGGVEAVY